VVTKKAIPTYTKVGIRVTVILMLLLTFFLLKNCSQSIFYGITTDSKTIDAIYHKGFTEGKDKATNTGNPSPYEGDNLALKKAYQKGFREGWDSVRQSRRK